jgi:hypothetical protein
MKTQTGGELEQDRSSRPNASQLRSRTEKPALRQASDIALVRNSNAELMRGRPASNFAIAAALREAAALLGVQNAEHFRVTAYLKAAESLENLSEDITNIAAQGVEALDRIPHVGTNIANGIIEMLSTGRWSFLERLRGELAPEQVFQSVPGIGPRFASLIHEHLHVDTLEALEAAAHDGRLATVPGLGDRRCAIIRNALASMLARRRVPLSDEMRLHRPPIELLLEIDLRYRTMAKAGELKLIRPRRFNPESKAWLPIMHAEKDGWHFTVLFSNTARAHELGKTGDWVVIFYSTDHRHEDQCTVVTETSGPHRGQRVVRGREKESIEHWKRAAETKAC